jgi:hypothetical protein
MKENEAFIGGSRDSAVSIATGYGLDDQGVGVQVPVCRLDRFLLSI